MKRLLAVVIPLAVIATLGLSGCDDDENEAGDDAASAAALVGATESDEFFPILLAAMRDAGSAHLEASVESEQGTLSAVGDVALGDDAGDSTVAATLDLSSLGQGDAEVRMVDGTLFAKLDPFTGGKFVRFDLDALGELPGAGSFGSADELDFESALEQARDAVSSIEPSGDPVSLDGVEAQGYDVTLDLTKIDRPKAKDGTKQDLPDEVTFTLFVGSDDLVRRVVADIDGASATIDFSQWGEPVEVSAPSGDELSDLDLSKLLQSFQGFDSA